MIKQSIKDFFWPIMQFIPRQYIKVNYKKHGWIIHDKMCEIAFDEPILELTFIKISPRKFESIKEFES